MIDQSRRSAGDPRLGTELGRLRLTGVIDDKQFAAGTLYAEVVGMSQSLKGMPRPTTRSPAYEIGAGKARSTDLEDEEIVEALRLAEGDSASVARKYPRLAAVIRASHRYKQAEAALGLAGKVAAKVVEGVAVEDRTALAWQHPQVVEGLDRLVHHFRETGQLSA